MKENIILFLILLKISNSIPTCDINSLQYEFTECTEKETQDLIIKNPNQCPLKNFTNFIKSKENIICQTCSEGNYLEYDIEKGKTICKECPSGYYSTGKKFVINGGNLDWNNKILDKFEPNTCILLDKTQKYLDEAYCIGFHVEDRKFLSSGGSLNINLDKGTYYIGQIGLNIRLVHKGKITFKYIKDSIDEDGYISGIFRFFINYIEDFVDESLSKNDSEKEKEKKYSKELEPGYYSFLFQYNKILSSEFSNKLSLKISYIEIEGIDSSSIPCRPCLLGTSNPGSSNCTLCEDGLIYNTTSNKCEECPNGLKGDGNFNCLGIQECNELLDFYETKEEICNIRTNTQKVKYNLYKDKRCLLNNIPKEKEVQCDSCPPGKYFHVLDSVNKKCEYCPKGYYSEEDNSIECKPCEGVIEKISYYTPNEKKEISKEIEILETFGLLSLDYEIKLKKKPYNIVLYIDKKKYELPILSKVTKIQLETGKHLIELDSVNLSINQLIITGTKEGSGYICSNCQKEYQIVDINNQTKCILCQPGYEFDLSEKNCIKCKEGYIKEGYGNKNKCHKCPTFSTPNEKGNFCQIDNIINYNDKKKLFLFDKYNKDLAILCKANQKLCKNRLYGPLQDYEKNLYYISYNVPEYFYSKEFPLNIPRELLLSPAYIYKLENESLEKSSRKQLMLLGNKITEIYLVTEPIDRGIIIKYIGEDSCLFNGTKKDTISYIYYRCSKNKYLSDGILAYNSPKLIKRDECQYYFEWRSPSGCPICLTNEVSKIESTCVKNSKKIFYNKAESCIIYEDSKILEKINQSTSPDNKQNFLLSEENKKLSEIYKITYGNHTDFPLGEYIFLNQTEESCEENKESFITTLKTSIILIIILSISLLIFIILLVCCCKIKQKISIEIDTEESTPVNIHE